jgi:signal transduction histidine kinase
MNRTFQISEDVQKVGQISIVPTILEVICNTTGMGFAAIARVTTDQWIACSVRDEINFGLKPGGELQIETTICSEIRDHLHPVVIDNVSQDEHFCNHHTPKMYGFQSYVSFPIFLKNGEFFGTLCAIDPKPANLNNSKIVGLFTLFTDLISYHLQTIDRMQISQQKINELTQQVSHTVEENRQYAFISNHNLQEPLRKIQLFSNMLTSASENHDLSKVKELSMKIGSSAQRFSMMIKDISDFARLDADTTQFKELDLNQIVSRVCEQLDDVIESKNAKITWTELPKISGLSLHLEQLFFHLITNAIKFSRPDVNSVIKIEAERADPGDVKHLVSPEKHKNYFVIRVEDNGIGIAKTEMEKVFHIFSKFTYEPTHDGYGVGLAYCRRIVALHGGFIKAESSPGSGTTFLITLPESMKD